MSGHRQAALALHGLTQHDQELILAELPVADQQTLRGYLAELVELGFDAPLPAAVRARVFSAPPGAATPQARLKAASATAMHAILGAEPASLVALVLRLGDWPWADDFLTLQPAARRAQVQAAHAAAAALAPAPARARFVLEAVAAQLGASSAGTAPAGAAVSLWTRVTSWVR